MRMLGWFLGFLIVFSLPVIGMESGSSSEQVERGKYLVHHMARCIECHTPRNSRGEMDRSRLLRGTPIPVKSPFANKQWAFRAPAIAGLPGWSERAAIHLLTMGKRESGYKPRAPMPEYRMTHEDAAAIVSYLKALD